MQLELPQPDPVALQHSAKLVTFITQRIAAAGGWISFAEYMELALYAPGLGYYSAGALKLGAAGDFVTAPEISALFSQCVAGQCAEALRRQGGGSILELGAGSGIMAADMLLELERLEILPTEYLILETSADLQERQQQTLAHHVPHLQTRVRWLEGAPEQPFRGVIIANEVVDALPVERFVIHGDEVAELGVSIVAERFVATERPATRDLLTAVQQLPTLAELKAIDGYSSELSLRLPGWVAALHDWLQEGEVLLFDYGYTSQEFYLPERSTGTLRCYYRHRAHEDPFVWPGLQDITAWVDFSRLAAVAQAAGFNVTGYTTQANFLLAAGMDEQVARAALDQPQAQAELAHALRQLLLPGEMGDSVKVLSLSKGGAAAPEAMQGRDMRAAL
jgi:SAM-dependent MidA family methyltransferase